jgi:hypothetical protein
MGRAYRNAYAVTTNAARIAAMPATLTPRDWRYVFMVWEVVNENTQGCATDVSGLKSKRDRRIRRGKS